MRPRRALPATRRLPNSRRPSRRRCAARPDPRNAPRFHRIISPDLTMTIQESKRNFLRSVASTAGAAAALAAFPPSIRRALAIPANNATGTINDVQHVVILMQENRSFEYYFGTLNGVRGFGDRHTIPLSNGRTVWQQLNGRRVVLPYRLDQDAGNAQCALDLPHTWPDAQEAWDGGRM